MTFLKVITGNIPHFHPKMSKPKSFQFAIFPAVCVLFWKFPWLRKFKTLETNKSDIPYAVLKRELQFFVSKTLQEWPWLVGKKIKIQRFLQSSEFFKKFPLLEKWKRSTANKCVIQEAFWRSIAVSRYKRASKWPQKNSKKKQILNVVWQINEFLIKVTINS